MESKTLSIVILNWNDHKSTLKCASSILHETSNSAEVIDINCTLYIVDNNSSDESRFVLKTWVDENVVKYKQNIIYIQSQKNLGYGGGNNLAIRIAHQNRSDFYMVINNDAALKKGSLDGLLSSFENPEVCVLGPAILDSRTGMVQSAGKKLDLFFGRHRAFRKLDVGIVKVGYVSGACILFTKEVIDVMSLFEERYFLYTEDVEFCYRATKHGLGVFCNTGCRAVHSSDGAMDMLKRKESRLYYQIRNNVLMSGLFSSKIHQALYRFFVLLRVFKKSFYFASRLKFSSCKNLFKAYIHGICNVDGQLK